MTRFSKTTEGNIRDTLLSVEWYPTSIRADTWQEAMDKVASLGDGWRAPTRAELVTLIDDTRRDPAVDVEFFENLPADWHWSSSDVVGWPGYAWFVYFGDGGVDYSRRLGSGFVRPVREVES